MIVICWNCRGLGKPSAVRSLTKLVRSRDPTLLFLCETRLGKREADKVRYRLGFANCFVVENDGGGVCLMLLWKGELNLSIQSYSKGHIDSILSRGSGEAIWRFTGFYGNPETSQRRHSWNLLDKL